MQNKIQSRETLLPLIVSLHEAGKTVVFTNGCFDILHIGHARYLQEAKALGDVLIIGLNSDASVRVLGKGDERPITPQQERAEVLAALSCVDFVTIFDEPDPHSLITILKPNVLVKGGDWAPEQIIGREVVESYGGTVQAIPLVPGVSTTRIIERIRDCSDMHSPTLSSQEIPEIT